MGLAAHASAQFEGTIRATLTRAGAEPVHLVFTLKAGRLRIEDRTNKLEPINIIDLKANRLTIVYPHNSTFVNVDLSRRKAQQVPSPPGPSLPPMASLPSPLGRVPTGAGGAPARPTLPTIPSGVGPNAGAGVATAGVPGAGGMPPLPPMPATFAEVELKKTDKAKKIQGLDCTLHTVTSRGETFEIWATNDSVLFPFQLITRDYIGRRFGPTMLEETWPELLRDKSLFPLEAILKMEPGGQKRLSFNVDKIEGSSRSSAEIDDKLFEPPENYIKIEAPRF